MKHDKEEDDILYSYLILCRLNDWIRECRETLQFYEIKNDFNKDIATKDDFLAEEILHQSLDFVISAREKIENFIVERDIFRYTEFYKNIFSSCLSYNKGISKSGDMILIPSIIDDLPINLQEKVSVSNDISGALLRFIAEHYNTQENQIKKAKMIMKRNGRAKRREKDWIDELQEVYNIRQMEEGVDIDIEDEENEEEVMERLENYNILDFQQFLKDNNFI